MFTGSDSKSSVYRHRCSQEADGAEPPESEPLDGRGEIPVRNLPRKLYTTPENPPSERPRKTLPVLQALFPVALLRLGG